MMADHSAAAVVSDGGVPGRTFADCPEAVRGWLFNSSSGEGPPAVIFWRRGGPLWVYLSRGLAEFFGYLGPGEMARQYGGSVVSRWGYRLRRGESEPAPGTSVALFRTVTLSVLRADPRASQDEARRRFCSRLVQRERAFSTLGTAGGRRSCGVYRDYVGRALPSVEFGGKGPRYPYAQFYQLSDGSLGVKARSRIARSLGFADSEQMCHELAGSVVRVIGVRAREKGVPAPDDPVRRERCVLVSRLEELPCVREDEVLQSYFAKAREYVAEQLKFLGEVERRSRELEAESAAQPVVANPVLEAVRQKVAQNRAVLAEEVARREAELGQLRTAVAAEAARHEAELSQLRSRLSELEQEVAELRAAREAALSRAEEDSGRLRKLLTWREALVEARRLRDETERLEFLDALAELAEETPWGDPPAGGAA